MKFALLGNQWFSEYLLDRLVEADLCPALVVAMPGERSKSISGYVDLAPRAEALGIEVHRPRAFGLGTNEDRAALAGRDLDALVVFGWQRLLPEWLLRVPRCGAWGVHGGPERPPRCRGQAVFNWALLLGCTRFYMYLFRLAAEADAGPIVAQREFDILPEDDALTLYHKNCVVSSRMIVESLPGIVDGTARLEPQTDDGATILPRRRPENGGIDWSMPAARVANLVRAVAPPYPGAFTEFDGLRVEVTRAQVFDTKIGWDAPPGVIVERFPNDDLAVMAGDGRAVYVRAWRCEGPDGLRRGARFAVCSGVAIPDPTL